MPPSKKKTFGQRIIAWRHAQKPKLSQAEAAELFGVNKKTLQNWEQECRQPMLELAGPILVRLSKDGF
jgi:DNA-binding transcriptional regulator YiaG